MKPEVIKILACPKCKSSLRLVSADKSKDRIYEGNLICSKCGASFKIVDDIACFMPIMKKDVDRIKVRNIQNMFREEIKKEWLKHFQGQEQWALKEEWKWMIDKLNLRQSKFHLDWASGTGRFLRRIVKKVVGNIIAIDNGYTDCVGLKGFLQEIGKYFNVSIIYGDARNMPIRDDSISSISSWHGVDEPKVARALDESKRVLKTNKPIAISGYFIKNPKSLQIAAVVGMRFVKKGEAYQYFQKLGFKDIEYKTFFEGKWLEKRSYLPRFGDYYTTYGISGKK